MKEISDYNSKETGKNILYLLSSANIYGGTLKKTLDLIKHSKNRCIIYFWSNEFADKQWLFKDAGAQIYVGTYGRNLVRHILDIVKIIDTHSIEIIQTQFSFGEVLGCVAKWMRPDVKVVVTFEGSIPPSKAKKYILQAIYRRVDVFVYISEYVRRERVILFPMLERLPGRIIYNGTARLEHSATELPSNATYKILAVSFLSDLKNIITLVRAVAIVVHRGKRTNVMLDVIGDGPQRANLESLIRDLHVENNVHLLGYRDDVGAFLYQCNLFAHPSLAEGFGIVIPEAMLAERPVIVANAGALPELVIDGQSGLIVDPLDPEQWAAAIILLMDDEQLAKRLAIQGKRRAEDMFSVEQYVSNYEALYKDLLDGSLPGTIDCVTSQKNHS